MKCPACQETTFVVEFNSIELDACPECRGIWFDSGELRLLLGDGAPLNLEPATTDEKPRPCPVCPEKMDKVNIGPGRRVLIDACPAGCGLFFDDRELADLGGDLQEAGWNIHPEVRSFLRDMFQA